MADHPFQPETLAIHAGQVPDAATGARALPIYQTTSFVFDSADHAASLFNLQTFGNVYSRLSNPTVAALEERVAALEGGRAALALASGMASEAMALMTLLQHGDHVVAAGALYGGSVSMLAVNLKKPGIETSFVDGSDLDAWEAAMRPQTKLLFLETPSNPTLQIMDIAAVAKIAESRGARLIVDNAFASPALQRPMELGAHVVVHSSTKFIDGQGRALGGMILCKEDFLEENLQQYLRNTGPAISPFNAWLHLKSLETLELRMKQHCENAQKVADFLAGQKKVTRVLYPFRADHPQHNLAKAQMDGGGGVVSFEVAGGKPAVFRLANALQLIDISNNLGDSKSLITHPETTTHQKMTPEVRASAGITSGLVRLSVGLEDADDLCEDLEQALKVA